MTELRPVCSFLVKVVLFSHQKLGNSKWSGPSCYWFGGAGWGFAGGGSKTDLVPVLNSEQAVGAFASGTQF
eukprot:TRINITY_DN2456_c0_g1_i1.p1 TRINITY_DN2456_c0_g1~~TRINITY_DN2456_c0_g1_i1.p1  ORF type:complete len:71 (-),score=10.32 TRINITY_DN2456_c0_g1_i1:98-310(-)